MRTRANDHTETGIGIGLPDRLKLSTDASGFEIVRSWRGWRTVLLTFLAIVWDAFLVFWYAQGFGIRPSDPATMFFVLFAVFCGAGLSYNALAGWLNRTRVRVDQSVISIRHEPLPWPGSRQVDGASLTQLYSVEHVAGRGRNPTITYEVHAMTASGADLKLLSGLDTSEQAIYIEQAIEQSLRIKDRPVPGQL